MTGGRRPHPSGLRPATFPIGEGLAPLPFLFPGPCPYCLLPAASVTTGYFLFFTLKKLTKWAAKVTAQEIG